MQVYHGNIHVDLLTELGRGSLTSWDCIMGSNQPLSGEKIRAIPYELYTALARHMASDSGSALAQQMAWCGNCASPSAEPMLTFRR